MRGGPATLIAVAFALAGAARADAPAWDPAVEPVALPDYLVTLAGGVVTLGANVLPVLSPGPSQRVDFDERARGVFRLKSLTAEAAVRSASDASVSALMAWPLAIDAALDAGWVRKNPKVAWRMAAVDLEAFAITGTAQGLSGLLLNRERPYGQDCGGLVPADDRNCADPQIRYRSFYSGHAAFAFTSAALICSHHVRLKLFGGGAAEAATCAVGFVVAAATSVFRMMGDMHYASDVLTGVVMGTLVGFLVPALHEYFGAAQLEAKPLPLQVRVVPNGAGLSVVGAW